MKLNTVGIALSYYREKYGLSMTQVCEGICSPATMFRIEEGYREVDSLVSATLLSRIGKQVLEFELLLNEKDYNLFRLRKDNPSEFRREKSGYSGETVTELSKCNAKKTSAS